MEKGEASFTMSWAIGFPSQLPNFGRIPCFSDLRVFIYKEGIIIVSTLRECCEESIR